METNNGVGRARLQRQRRMRGQCLVGLSGVHDRNGEMLNSQAPQISVPQFELLFMVQEITTAYKMLLYTLE